MPLRRLVAPLFALTLTLPFMACSDSADATSPTGTTSGTTIETTTFAPSLGIDLAAAGWTKTSTGLYYRVLTTAPATAAAAANGQRVSVRYTGWLANGTQFDTGTIPFTLGRGEVIAGWDQGILGMRVGERRTLVIPSSLGYGARGTGPIPGNAVLVFTVELLSAT